MESKGEIVRRRMRRQRMGSDRGRGETKQSDG